MPDYYEINVSLNGIHFFATAPRSITSQEKAESVFQTFRNKFAESDGYEILVTHWQSAGTHINF